MITVNTDYVEVGKDVYHALLARQFQRLIQWNHDRNEERWVKEGLAELAVRLNGLDPGGLERAYLEHPDTSLTAWDNENAAAHRGAAYLFATHFHDRFGDEGTRALVAQTLNGVAGFDAALAELGADLTFEDLFAEWLAANYRRPEQPAPAAIYENYPITVETSVQQFGADYILLHGDGDLNIHFVGATDTPLLDLLPHSESAFWWSNRADESLTTLTRAFDLSNVKQATLTYWTWYDIEPGYDYATVEVSTDPSTALRQSSGQGSGHRGGEQWHILSTPSGSDANPHGNNPGWGYTGHSEGWVREEVDLTPYAGGEVLVRFAYLTDEAVTGAGFVLDDVTIPEIGYADEAENDGGWQAAGFVHSDNAVPQRYMALLISMGDEITVERLLVEEDQTADWTAPLGSENLHEAVLVLSGLSPLTTQPALYQLTIEE
jgi:hypothetical protein